MKKLYLFAFLALAGCFASFSQVTTSNIRGLIQDDQNQPLLGANVVAIHTPTGSKYGGTSNFDGWYNLMNMRVGGPYEVTISYIGFKEQKFDEIYLSLGKTFSLDVKLIPDSQQLNEVVLKAVVGAGNVFGNDRTGAATNVGRKELTTLPTISRSQADFTRLEPSSSNGSFGGRNDQFNNFSLDGLIFNNPFGLDSPTPGGQTGAQPVSIDAIDQIQVSIAPYDVTQAGFTGASVNAVTKSGTNEFHGTVYGFYRDEKFTGKKINGQNIFRGDLLQQQYGLSIGGPILKDKLFFFANFESDERDDLGSPFAPKGSGSANESRVKESDLIAVQSALRGLGYDPGNYKNYNLGTGSVKSIFKLDWNINDNHKLAFIYNYLDAYRELPAHPTALGFRGPSLNTLQFENAGYQINNELSSFLVELNSNLGKNISNKFQAGYTKFTDFRNPKSVPAPSITIQEGGSNYIIAGHEPFSINNKLGQKVYQVTDNMNITNGNHTFTIGTTFERFEFANSFNLGSFGARGVFFPTSPSVASFLADAALPLSDPNSIAALLKAATDANAAFTSAGDGNIGGFNLYKANYGQLAFYAQDEWNVNEDFKLTYGIRFDKPLYFNSAKLAADYIKTQPAVIPGIEYFNPITGAPRTFDSTQQPTNAFLVSPRVGFNWDVKGDETLQLRGGSGMFSGRLPFVWLGNQTSAPNFFFFQAVDPNFKWPQVWRTNLGLDYRFENDVVASVDLSYTKDIKGAHVQNFGLKPPTGTLAGVDNRAIYADADRVKVFGGNADAFVFVNSNKGRTYNATFKLQKQFENNLFLSLAYNYLDARDVNSIQAEITSDAFAANAARGNVNAPVLTNSEYGDKHRFIGVVSKKWNYHNDKMSSSVAAFFEYAQGARFSYIYGGDINNDGSGINDLIYIPTASEISSMNFSGAGQAAALEAFIKQDDYLSNRRGKYADRFGALSPWRGKWDVKFVQELKVYSHNAIQFSADILNIGNLINSHWGVVQQPNNIQAIGVTVDPLTSIPTYTFDPNLKDSFGFDSSLNSRWQMQIGLRYIF